MNNIQDKIDIAMNLLKVDDSHINSKSPKFIALKVSQLLDIDVSEEDILINQQPTLEEEIQDLVSQYSNLGL